MNDQECIQNNTCKNCGGSLERVSQRTYRCQWCLHTYTMCDDALPIESKRLILQGQDSLDNNHFEDAFSHFKKAAELSPNEPEVHWGLALARHKIRYLKDYRNTKDSKEKFRLQPICYEPMNASFSKDEYFLKALELAKDEKQRESYLERAKEIDYIQKKFLEYSKDERYHFDCFICVKVTELENADRFTADSHYADNIYTFLQKNGICPFYSEKVAKEYAGADYEALILYALSRASSFLMVISDDRYLETPWVKNEYTRYLSMVKDQKKEEDSIVICYHDHPIQRLSIEDHVRQGIDLKSPSAFFDLLEFVRSHQNTAMQPILLKEYQERKFTPKTFAKKKVNRQSFLSRNTEADISQAADIRVVKQMLSKGQKTPAQMFINNALKKNNQFSHMYYFRYQINGDTDDLLRAFSCSTKEEYQNYFSEKFEEMKTSFDPDFYQAFVSLENAGQEEIDLLNHTFQDNIIRSDDEKLIRLYLSTISNETEYVETLLFLKDRAADKEKKIQCLEKALEYAPEREEISWELFTLNHEMSFLLKKENQREIEEELFSYGYHSLASEKIYQYATNQLEEPENRQKAIALFSFIISLMPREDPLLIQRAENIVRILKRLGLFDETKPFLNLLLSLKPDSDEYYFEIVMAKNHVVKASDLLFLYKNLVEDEDYLNCVRCYSEKYPDKDNFYLELISQFEQIQQIWDPELEQYYKSFEVTDPPLNQLNDRFIDYLRNYVNSLMVDLIEKNGCNSLAQFETLPIDCNQDPLVLEAKKILVIINRGKERISYPDTLSYVLDKQASMLRFNQKRDRYFKRFQILSQLIPVLVMLVSTICFFILPLLFVENIRLLSLPTLIPIYIGVLLLAIFFLFRTVKINKVAFLEKNCFFLQIANCIELVLSFAALFLVMLFNSLFLLSGSAVFLNSYAVLIPLVIKDGLQIRDVTDYTKRFEHREFVISAGYFSFPVFSLVYSLAPMLTMAIFGVYQMDLAYQITYFVATILLSGFSLFLLLDSLSLDNKDYFKHTVSFLALPFAAAIAVLLAVPIGYWIATAIFNHFPLMFTLSSAIIQTFLTLCFGFIALIGDLSLIDSINF